MDLAVHDSLAQLLGLRFTAVGEGGVSVELDVRDELLAPNGFLHAAALIAMADMACGYASMTTLPPGAHAFTTIELKTNFLGTAREGTVMCEAHLQHGGRTTQVWDATVRAGDRTIALFRCTQLMLYPK
ncbi:MAG: PaaI family thioesterase [Gaiellaceae bacterium]